MKRIVAVMLAIFCLLSMLTYASDQTDNAEWSNIKVPKDEIILIERYINYAWGYANEGVFIDSNGGVYSFDFSEINGANGETDEQFLDKLQMIRKYAEPFATLDKEMLSELYWYSNNINIKAEMPEKHTVCDAGETQIFICAPDTHELVLCRQKGDFTGTLKDTNAKKLLSLYDKTIQRTIKKGMVESETINPKNYSREINYTDKYLDNVTYYYTSNDVHIENINCGYTKCSGKYVITNAEQLERFTRKTGISLEAYDWSSTFPSDRFVYFVEIKDVGVMDLDLKKSGIICKGGVFELIDAPNSSPLDKAYPTAMDGFCFVAEFPKSIAMQYRDLENGTYRGLDGSVWIEP